MVDKETWIWDTRQDNQQAGQIKSHMVTSALPGTALWSKVWTRPSKTGQAPTSFYIYVKVPVAPASVTINGMSTDKEYFAKTDKIISSVVPVILYESYVCTSKCPRSSLRCIQLQQQTLTYTLFGVLMLNWKQKKRTRAVTLTGCKRHEKSPKFHFLPPAFIFKWAPSDRESEDCLASS